MQDRGHNYIITTFFYHLFLDSVSTASIQNEW